VISTSVGLFEERALFNVSFSSLGSSTVNPSPPHESAYRAKSIRCKSVAKCGTLLVSCSFSIMASLALLSRTTVMGRSLLESLWRPRPHDATTPRRRGRNAQVLCRNWRRTRRVSAVLLLTSQLL